MDVEDPPGTAPPPERAIGRYRVLGVLGAGAMGEVVRARDDRLGRDVAIKRMRSLLGGLPPAFSARFEAEGRALAALTHPGVVQVYDLGVDDDQPYLVMELVDGPSLRDILGERGALPVADVRAAGIQLARALEAAHARGVVHRDVKPANVLLAPGGVWKLADFGVAHVPDSSVTLTGQFLGTPAYAAPEALTLGAFGPASDVFGLAATLYEAATGVRPRGDATLSELLARSDQPVVAADMPPPPPELAAALRAGLAIDPGARPSAAAFAEQLAAAATTASASTPSLGSVAVAAASLVTLPAPAARRRSRRRLIAIVAAAVGGLAALAWLEPDATPGPRRPPASPPPRAPAPAAWSEAPRAFAAPPGLDAHGARDWSKIADRVHDGKYRDALRRLDELERRHGVSDQSTALRQWLAAAVADGLGDAPDHD